VDEKKHPRVDPKLVYRAFDSGKMPSAVAAELNVSLAEVLDALERRRHESAAREERVTK
jgi:hypothetical protein